jgi:hypothetical protein
MRSSNLHRNMKKTHATNSNCKHTSIADKSNAMLEAKTDKKASHGKKDISSILANQ